MNDPARGQLADGQTAALHDVLLSVVEGALLARRASDGVEVVRWPLAGLRAEPLDGGRATLTSPAAPDASLTVAADYVATHLGAPRGLAPPVSRLRKILLYAGGSVAVAVLIYLNLDPVARAIAQRVPPRYEAQLGQGLQQFLESQYCETPAERAALARMADRLGGGATELHIMNSDMVNAFTFPGGLVIVTKGLVGEAVTSDEVAGVLAHELEHVKQRHVMTHFVRSSMMTALWQASVGDFTGLLVIDPKTAFDIANLRFSRADEAEADRGAVARLAAAGISRDGFRDFFERMRAKTDAVPAWLSNHPTSADRITAIGQDVGAVARTPALSADDWKLLKSACGGSAAAGKSPSPPR